MELLGIALAVFLMYWQTLNFHYVIDDEVKRGDYLYALPALAPGPDFYKTKPSSRYRLFMVSMHAVNAVLVGAIFGWPAGLLFAVHPLGVVGTAWVTGNYYATTAYFTLIALWMLFHNYIWFSMVIFMVAMQSTITAIAVPFVFLLVGPVGGVTWFMGLIGFFMNPKFQEGFRRRNERKTELKISYPFTWRRPAAIIKVIAFYLRLGLFPQKLGFFRPMGDEYIRQWTDEIRKTESYNLQFWVDFFTILCFGFLGLQYNIFGTCWFFITIAAFTPYVLLGQYVAERYMYLPLIGLCAVAGTVLAAHPVLLAVCVTTLAYRTLLYIPAYRTIQDLYKNDADTWPNSPMSLCQYAQSVIFEGEHGLMTAYIYLARAEKLSQKYFEVFANMGVVWILRKRGNDAVAYIKKAMSLSSPSVTKPVLDALQAQLDSLIKVMPASAVETKVMSEQTNPTETRV